MSFKLEAQACGAGQPCMLGERNYRVRLPEGFDRARPQGAIVYVHGYRGKAENVMRNEALAGLADRLGVVFAAAQAAGPEWNIPNIPSDDRLEGVDELAYFDALFEDLSRRFGVDRSRTIVTGFSSGAMMVWYLACYRADKAAGFVPMSGTFWAPVPSSCPSGRANIIHYHGLNDRIVPLHGQAIKDARQGDVLTAIELFSPKPEFSEEGTAAQGSLECARRTGDQGHLVELCLFPGKHEMRIAHIIRAAGLLGVAVR
ncbi:polyhydroxybutyrate depolymerase [Hongsoonwoonella zoysiae]|uniref:alpha/beta hydrolase family esterase n=1 Tax=Hongsoonwoonella zoysiae TaxID=2821844 RepID=UPI0031B5C4A1